MLKKLNSIKTKLHVAVMGLTALVAGVMLNARMVMCSGFDSLAKNEGMVNMFNKAAPVYAKFAWLPFVFCLFKYFTTKSDQKVAGHYKAVCIGIAIGYAICGVGAITLHGVLTDIEKAFTAIRIMSLGC